MPRGGGGTTVENHSPQKYKRCCNSGGGGAYRPRNAVSLSFSPGGGGAGSFAACGEGRGLEGLARELRDRCMEVKR